MSGVATAVAQAATLLSAARRAVVLTGAGISTPSGIPDFRSRVSGLWRRHDPLQVATIDAFRRRPEEFYEWVRPLARAILEAAPNPAHLALATLESHCPVTAVITQNIDNLHRAAGSRVVHEVHGHLRTARCLRCHYVQDATGHVRAFVASGKPPRCPRCDQILKPDVILFGEVLPAETFAAAQRATYDCDLMLVAGSSLEVYPVCDLPGLAHSLGSRLLIVNETPTPYDDIADVAIHDDVATVLPALVAAFRQPAGE